MELTESIDNVLLLTIDCLRADRFDSRAWNIFPDGISTVSFKECIATGPGTSTAFPGILFSTYPLEYSGYGKIKDSRTSLAKVFRKNGVSTAGFHSNPLLAESVGYGQGFETFYDSIDSKRQINSLFNRILPDTLHQVVKNAYFKSVKYQDLPYNRAEHINERILTWVDGREEDWFCWAHYMDPHHPYKPPSEYTDVDEEIINDLWNRMNNEPEGINDNEVKILQSLYDSEIRYLQEQLKDLFLRLQHNNQLSNTLIVVLADHGEAFREHGELAHPPLLYDELIHVPLVFASKAFSESENVSSLVSTIDVAPTILKLSNEGVPSTYRGESLFSSDYAREGALTELSHESGGGGEVKLDEIRVSYRTSKWKYIHDRQTGEDELYNLSKDPVEQNNVIENNPDVRDELYSVITEHLTEIVDDHSRQREEVDESVEQRLIDLGYR